MDVPISDMNQPPIKKIVTCGNTRCKKYICTVYVCVSNLGEIFHISNLRCSHCGEKNQFTIVIRDADLNQGKKENDSRKSLTETNESTISRLSKAAGKAHTTK